MFMTERNRLWNWRRHACHIGRAIHGHSGKNKEYDHKHRRDDACFREGVGTGMKDLRHVIANQFRKIKFNL